MSKPPSKAMQVSCRVFLSLLADASQAVVAHTAQGAGQVLPFILDADPARRAGLSSELLPLLKKLCTSRGSSWQSLAGVMSSLPALLKASLSEGFQKSLWKTFTFPNIWL